MYEVEKARLAKAAEACTGLSGLLPVDKSAKEAIILREGAERFSLGVKSLEEVEALLRVIDGSFTEEGPRLPNLLRELANLPPAETVAQSSARPLKVGIFECDRGGKIATWFKDNAAKFISDKIPKPWDGRRDRMKRFYASQQIITEELFSQDGGKLINPNLLDVFGSYLQEVYQQKFHRRWESFPESIIFDYHDGFENQAAQVLYKIRYMGRFSEYEYKKVGGLRRFERMMDDIIRQYEDILDVSITAEILEKIALRDQQTLLDYSLI